MNESLQWRDMPRLRYIMKQGEDVTDISIYHRKSMVSTMKDLVALCVLWAFLGFFFFLQLYYHGKHFSFYKFVQH